MRAIQPIEHRGHVVALVIEDVAILSEHLSTPDRRFVQAKCLYALEIRRGVRPGPYEDDEAVRYAARAIVSRCAHAPRRSRQRSK
jgi:hypothetical protein